MTPREKQDRYGSRDLVSVDLIHSHYKDIGILNGMSVDKAMDLCRELGVGIYELCALANFHDRLGRTDGIPTAGLVDNALKVGFFPPTVGLHFRMFQNSCRMMNGRRPELLIPIHLIDRGKELEEKISRDLEAEAALA